MILVKKENLINNYDYNELVKKRKNKEKHENE